MSETLTKCKHLRVGQYLWLPRRRRTIPRILRVVRLANMLGDSSLLDYDWIPALPGINYPGDYRRDYAHDPVAWIRREQNGEFA